MSRTRSSTLSWYFLPHTLSNFAATVHSFTSTCVSINREGRIILISVIVEMGSIESKRSYSAREMKYGDLLMYSRGKVLKCSGAEWIACVRLPAAA